MNRFTARATFAVLLFVAAATYFVARGPWRAVGSVNSYDFASVYGAARNWVKGDNPYDMRLVLQQAHAAGDDPATLPNADGPPIAYLPTTLPLLTSVSWLSWKAARLIWSLLSIAAFLFSVAMIFRSCVLSLPQKLLLGAGILLFSPTTSGLSTGNPSVISCALTLAAIFLALENRHWAAAIVLGFAHAIKPQMSIAGLAVFLIWGYWRTAGLSFIVPVITACISFVRAGSFHQYRVWLLTLQGNIAGISQPGGMADPSPADYFSYHLVNEAALLMVWLRNVHLVSVLVWVTSALLAGAYLWLRHRSESADRLRDVAFCCTLVLVPVYHRYYDAQLLLGIVPFLVAADRTKAKTITWACLLVLLFPLQAILAASLPGLSPTTLAGFVLLRHQPVIILLLCFLLLEWPAAGTLPRKPATDAKLPHAFPTRAHS